MEDQSPRPEDAEPMAVNREDGELRVPHEQDNSNEQLRRLEKWQFRKSWEKFFGDIAKTEEIDSKAAEIAKLHPDQLNLDDYDKSLKWSSELEESLGHNEEPAEKLYELRQEIKDAPTPAKGAASVGKVMAEALQQRQANIPTQLAASESLHLTAQKQTSKPTTGSLYKQAVIMGIAGGVLVLIIMIIAALLRS